MERLIPLSAFNHATRAVIASDANGTIRFCNGAARRMLGLAFDDPLPPRCWALAPFRRADGGAFCGPECAVRRAALEGRSGSTHRVVPARGAASDKPMELVSFFVPAGDDEGSVILHVVVPVDGADRTAARDLSYDGGVWRPSGPVALSARERHVLHLIASGHSPAATAASLGITATTVRNHLQSVFRKLGVHRRIDAAIAAGGLGAHEYDV